MIALQKTPSNGRETGGRAITVIAVVALLLTSFPVISSIAAASGPGNTYQVSVSTNSTFYSGSQTVVLTGAISPAPGNGTSAFVRIFNPDKTTVHIDSVPVNGTTGKFNDSFISGGTNWINGNCTVNVTWAANISGPEYFGVAFFFYTSISVTVNVFTTSLFYSDTQPIDVTGTVAPTPGNGTSAFIEVYNPDGTVVHVDSVPVSGTTGQFNDSFNSGGTNWINGTYTLRATWAASINGPTFSGNTSFSYSPLKPKLVAVSFSESGLPLGFRWSVTLNGTTESSSTKNISFSNVPFGIYAWSVLSPLSGGTGVRYVTSSLSGSITVPLTVNVSISFRTQYQVTVGAVNGTSSPSGTAWYNGSSSVTLHATPDHGFTFITWKSSTTRISIARPLSLNATAMMNGTGTITANFQKPIFTNSTNTTVSSNGTASVRVNSTVGNMTIDVSNATSGSKLNITLSVLSNSSGATSVTPTGTSSISMAIVVSVLDLRVNTTSTLSNGTVRICYNNRSVTSSTVMLYWNGTAWNYALNESIKGTTICGSIPIIYLKGTPLIVGTVYAAPPPPPSYPVIFAESGLPSGTPWSVTLNGQLLSSSGTQIYFSESSGTYPFTVGSVDGYVATPSSGSVTVNGAAVLVNITFSPRMYPIEFVELGLPTGALWNVSLNSYTKNSTTGSISFSEPNGSYSFTVGIHNGYRASPYSSTVNVTGANVTVHISFSIVTYPVTFSESGLPSGVIWSVEISGLSLQTNSTSMTFNVSNGTHPFTVSAPGWRPSPSSAMITVNGTPVKEAIAFALATYSINFTETGLPSGTAWSVTFNGTASSSSASNISFTAPNGTYSYEVAHVAGYSSSLSSGNITVNGSSVRAEILFSPVTYGVTFTESGLPSGAAWYVNVSGQPSSGPQTSSSYSSSLPNGSYKFTVFTPDKEYKPSYSGSFSVKGKAVSLSILFSLVTYSVTFTETGLPSGTLWNFTINGTVEQSSGNQLTIPLPNGSYPFTIGESSGFSSVPASGTVAVNGKNVSESVSFTYYIYVTGTISPSNASLYINGKLVHTTNGSFNMTLTPGTYEFKTSSPGYGTLFSNVTYTYHSQKVQVKNISLSRRGIPSLVIYIVAIVVVIIAIVSAVVLYAMRRRKSMTQDRS